MSRLSLVTSVLLCGACGASAPAAQTAPSGPDACGQSLAALHATASPGWAEVPEGPVRAVRVAGARTVPERLVRDAVELPVGEPIDPAAVRKDIRSILALRVFEDVRVHADASPDGVTVTYEVVERPLVRQVHASGIGEGVDERRLQAVEGEVFVPERLQRLARKLTAEHRREGYAKAVTRVRGRDAGAGKVDVCFAVEPGRRWLVEQFDFAGNERLDDDALSELVETFDGRVNTAGGVYREDLLAADLQRIRAAYYDRGMVEVRVSEPRTRWADDGLHVQVPIEEGAVYSLGRITVTGDLDGSASAYLELADLRSGEVFSRERVAAAIERIRKREAGRGPASVWPTTQLDRDDHTVDLEIEIELHDEPDASGAGQAEEPVVDVELTDDELHIDNPPPEEAQP